MRSAHKGPCLLGGQVGLTSQTGQPRASGLLGKAGFPASMPQVKKHHRILKPAALPVMSFYASFPPFLTLALSLLNLSSSPFFPSPLRCCRSSEARLASEVAATATEKDAAPAAASPGKPLAASAEAGTSSGRGSSGPALRPPPSPTPASWPSSSAPAPPKASPSREKLPYVPHSPFHLFSYDFEDSPLSTKEKEAESQQESR